MTPVGFRVRVTRGYWELIATIKHPQVADLVARPIGIKALRPTQPNRAYEILEAKFRRSPNGEFGGWGLKSFP